MVTVIREIRTSIFEALFGPLLAGDWRGTAALPIVGVKGESQSGDPQLLTTSGGNVLHR